MSAGKQVTQVTKSSAYVVREIIAKFGILLGLFVLMIVFAALSPSFLTATNLTNILIQTGTNAVIAAGMTL